MIGREEDGERIVSDKVLCNTTLKRATGLMFRRRIKDCGYIFSFKKDVIAGIHMFFVFFPIDIVWLDKEKRIVEMRENVKPFTPSVIPEKKCRFFIELPKGVIEDKGLKEGEKVYW